MEGLLMFEFNDALDFEIDFNGTIDNYTSPEELSFEIKKMLDEWLTWNIDGDVDFYVTEI